MHASPDGRRLEARQPWLVAEAVRFSDQDTHLVLGPQRVKGLPPGAVVTRWQV